MPAALLPPPTQATTRSGSRPSLPARLLDRLAADDRLKIADDPRKRMRPDDRAENVMRRFDRAHPIAHGFVDGVAQRPRAAGDRPHFGPQQPHAEDVRPLAADILLAHVDDAFQAEAGAGRGRGHAVLAGAGFGDHAVLAHPHGQQRLAERVVDLVGAGVIQVFALEIDLGAAGMLGSAAGRDTGAKAGRRSAPTDRPARPESSRRHRPGRIGPTTRRAPRSAFPARSGRRNRQNGLWRRVRGCWLAWTCVQRGLADNGSRRRGEVDTSAALRMLALDGRGKRTRLTV